MRLGPSWYLEGFIEGGESWLLSLPKFPFLIGRHSQCQLRLLSLLVSRRHAEIYQRDETLWIRELGSTNGTFVNRQRLTGECPLAVGDTLHMGPYEFRVGRDPAVEPVPGRSSALTRKIIMAGSSQNCIHCEREFSELLRRQAVSPYFQPIVKLSDHTIVGYELLGRGDCEGLPRQPAQLLQIARQLDKEVELSGLFRRVGLQQAGRLGRRYQKFFNTVPAEITLEHLQRALPKLRMQFPSLPLAMEVPAAIVLRTWSTMKRVRALLDKLDIQLVYDNFSADQTRLVELLEVPPDYLKFDMGLIRNIHCQSATAQRRLQSLVYTAGELGVKTVAKGVEMQEELAICTRFGFDLAQGYYFGKPQPRFQHLSAYGLL